MGTFNLKNNDAMDNITASSYEADMSTVLGETFSYIRSLNPVPLMSRSYERVRSREGSLDDPLSLVVIPEKAPDPKVDKNTLNEQYSYLGLHFDEDDTEFAAQSLADAKEIELSQQSMMQSGRGGVVETTAKFGIGLAATIVDPLNIASMLVFPPLAGAKFFSSAAKVGVNLTRLKSGARSGFLGTAAIEPLVYGLARQEQKDYDFTHSLLNVAAGTVLGGGLHLVGGKVKDVVGLWSGNQTMKTKITELQNIQNTKLNTEAKDVLFQVAMRQFVQGKNIDVEKLFKFFTKQQELSPQKLVNNMTMKQLQFEIKAWLKNTKNDPVYKEALKNVNVKLNQKKADLQSLLHKLHAIKQGGAEELMSGNITSIEKALAKGDKDAFDAINTAANTPKQSEKLQPDLDKVNEQANRPDVNVDVQAAKKHTDEMIINLQEDINSKSIDKIDPDNAKRIKEADNVIKNAERDVAALKAAMRCLT